MQECSHPQTLNLQFDTETLLEDTLDFDTARALLLELTGVGDAANIHGKMLYHSKECTAVSRALFSGKFGEPCFTQVLAIIFPQQTPETSVTLRVDAVLSVTAFQFHFKPVLRLLSPVLFKSNKIGSYIFLNTEIYEVLSFCTE